MERNLMQWKQMEMKMEMEEAPRARILVIDDDPLVLDFVKSALSEEDYAIHTVTGGREAVEVAKAQKFDLAITDLRMPGMDGVETLAALKEVSPETEVIVATGDGTIETAITCMKLGAYDYLQKPFQVKELHAIVERALEKRKLKGIVSLYESSRKLLTTLDHVELIHLVTEQGRRLLQAGEVILLLEEEGLYDIHEANGDLRISGTVVRTLARRSAEAGNEVTCCRCLGHDREGKPVSVYAEVFPLVGSKGRLGVLIALYEEGEKRGGDWEAGSLFATLATMALENAALYQRIQVHLETQRKTEEQLRHNAFHDTLTGLPNRALFLDRLSNTMHRARRRHDQHYAVLFLDLDRFKIINDSLGHAAGDRLLVETARRLEACLRASDTVARFGGDEFTVLLTDIRDAEDAVRTAQRIHEILEEPIDLNGQRVFVSTSIGIAFGSPSYEAPEEILRDADIAMYQAKERGAGGHVIFDEDMHCRAITKLQLESDLRQALARNELQVYYQPILSLDEERLIGFEALVRWNHPLRGFVTPFEFLPLAEETGLIVPIDRWVMREACRQMYAWQKGFPELESLTISVNVSTHDLARSDFIASIDQILRETGLPPKCLNLEITENAIIRNEERIKQIFAQLRARKIELHLDDFGTGYSSLSYLHEFPFTTLKIDRSFIKQMGLNPKHREIVRTIVLLAKNLGMSLIAEGVETREDIHLLRQMDCEQAQGYFFARPLDAPSCAAWLQQRRAAEDSPEETDPLTPHLASSPHEEGLLH